MAAPQAPARCKLRRARHRCAHTVLYHMPDAALFPTGRRHAPWPNRRAPARAQRHCMASTRRSPWRPLGRGTRPRTRVACSGPDRVQKASCVHSPRTRQNRKGQAGKARGLRRAAAASGTSCGLRVLPNSPGGVESAGTADRGRGTTLSPLGRRSAGVRLGSVGTFGCSRRRGD